MKRKERNRRSQVLRGLTMAAVLIFVTVAAASSPALAGDRHARKHHRARVEHIRRGHGHMRGPVVRYRPAVVVVPGRIGRAHVRRYDPYFRGRVWYGPHRHYHAVYRFPVRTRYGVVYRRYAYCAGSVFFEPVRPRVGGYVSIGGPEFQVTVGW